MVVRTTVWKLFPLDEIFLSGDDSLLTEKQNVWIIAFFILMGNSGNYLFVILANLNI